MHKYNYLSSFLFSLMKKGNEKNQENLMLYCFSLVSQHFVGTLSPEARSRFYEDQYWQ